MIAVTAANGQLGRLILKQLAHLTGTPVRALVRTPEKARDLATAQVSVVKGDYNDPESLRSALEGVERLVLISGNDIGNRVPQHKAVIEAAKAAGVSFVVYTSVLKANSSDMILGAEHLPTEQALAESGLAHAILRNGWYLENYDGTVQAALAHGAVFGAAGDGLIAAAGREDYAEAAAKVVAGDDVSSRTYELAGEPAFTLADLAAQLSEKTGRAIAYQNLSEAEYEKALVGAGLPEGFAKAVADADRAASQGALDSTSADLRKLLGRPTLSLSDYIGGILAKTGG
ncbi:NAD(P)-dependent oxidoreductase [Roseibium aquae]|uniref:NAD(P)-dependent oxidoreductase n=1 Tax=Roseibium aquae TaxID=1323746 RepID=A0A916X296_9HYPH|nr:SDR family oxidoreductase [Roseibium aquae]GGB50573.1 NAD(P)-dependent oxidoreductase [Roseibium aquae]